MNTNNWIKITDRKPEFPAWLWSKALSLPVLYRYTSEEVWRQFTHWQPANIPAPPPKELTQREKDIKAYDQWWHSVGYCEQTEQNAYLAALAWEREQIDDDFFEALFRWRDNDRDMREQDEFIRDFFRARREGGNK